MLTRFSAIAGGVLLAVALPVSLQAQEVPQETVERITSMLADMQCEMDPEDIEVTGEGYELDDVFCADGQYDIELDDALNVTEKRKE